MTIVFPHKFIKVFQLCYSVFMLKTAVTRNNVHLNVFSTKCEKRHSPFKCINSWGFYNHIIFEECS